MIVRTLNSANVGTDHKLVLAKLRIHPQKVKQGKPVIHTQFNRELLEDKSIEYLYQRRLEEKLSKNCMKEDKEINDNWKVVENTILQAAFEALGTRRVNTSQKKVF